MSFTGVNDLAFDPSATSASGWCGSLPEVTLTERQVILQAFLDEQYLRFASHRPPHSPFRINPGTFCRDYASVEPRYSRSHAFVLQSLEPDRDLPS